MSIFVIEGEKLYEFDLNGIRTKIAGLENKKIIAGYDVHAGFRFFDSSWICYVLDIGKEVRLQPTIIDESEQWGKRNFSPLQVVVELNGVEKRRRVGNGKSKYSSQHIAELEDIKMAYSELDGKLYKNEIRLLLDMKDKNYAINLGDFQANLHEKILRKQLAFLEKICVLPAVFDRYNVDSGKTSHLETAHKRQDVLFIGLLKDPHSLMEKFSRAREEGKLGENPRLVVAPVEPQLYFRGNYEKHLAAGK